VNGQAESTTTAPADSSATRKVFRIPVSNGLLAAKHYRAMGESVWLFLYLIDKITLEKESGDGNRFGSVLRGMPLHDSEIAREFGVSVDTISRWRLRLAKHGYIHCRRTPHGYSITVSRSKKFIHKDDKPKKPTLSDPAKMPDHSQGDPAESRSDPAFLRSDPARMRDVIRQCSDSTVTKQKAGASRGTGSISEIEERVLAAYRAAGIKPTWGIGERRKLQELAEHNSAQAILLAFNLFLEWQDDWLVEHRHPFNAFNKRFSEIVEEAHNCERRRLQDEFDSIAFIDQKQACGSTGRTPVDVAHVKAFGTDYWIDRRNLKFFADHGICVEVRPTNGKELKC